MGTSLNDQQILLKQGIEWLKTNQDKLVTHLTDAMSTHPELTHQKLPGFLRKLVAKDMLQDLIKRLERNSFDATATQQKMVDGLKKGATLKSLVASIDLMVEVINAAATREFAARPAVYDILMNRTGYFATLIKSVAATAAIEYEKSRIKNN